ncbi:MAG: antibiotic biosynthesis monooxygenase family protein [Phycisphaerales bacterium]
MKMFIVIAAVSIASVGVAAVGCLGIPVSSAVTGPGYTPGKGLRRQGGVGSEVTEKPVVFGVTNVIFDRRKRSVFLEHTQRVRDSLPEQPGYLASALRIVLMGNEAWTMTAWDDATSLDAMVASPIHREAVRQGMPAVVRARFLRFQWPPGGEPPSWREIRDRLESVPWIEYR